MMKTLECSNGRVDFDGGQMLNVLNGFLILLDMHGKVLYVSEHVSRYLKYQPVSREKIKYQYSYHLMGNLYSSCLANRYKIAPVLTCM